MGSARRRSLVDFDGAVDLLDESVGSPEADGARQQPERDDDDGRVAEAKETKVRPRLSEAEKTGRQQQRSGVGNVLDNLHDLFI